MHPFYILNKIDAMRFIVWNKAAFMYIMTSGISYHSLVFSDFNMHAIIPHMPIEWREPHPMWIKDVFIIPISQRCLNLHL